MAGRPAISAALRRAVLVEAGHRCAIPTCRATQVDLAHIEPWAKVREHTFENLLALCPNCHRRHHAGEIDTKSLLAYKAQLSEIVPRPEQTPVSAITLLSGLADPTSSLSACVLASLALASARGDIQLEEFCRNELLGYADDDDLPRRRWVTGYASAKAGGQLHPMAGGFGGVGVLWNHLVSSDDFVFQRVALLYPIAEIAAGREARDARPNALATISMPASSVYADWPSELELTCYMEACPHQRVVDSVRAGLAGELSRMASVEATKA